MKDNAIILKSDQIEPEWYAALIEECKAIITEAVFTSRWALVEGYHTLGERILQEHKNFDRAKIYGEKIVQRVALSLEYSPRTIFQAIQFARKYPDLSKVPEGKNITWHKICNKYLPAHEEDDEIDIKNKKGIFEITDNQSVIQCDALITDPPYGILDKPWEPKDLEKFTKDWANCWSSCGADFALIFFSQRFMWLGRKWFDESLSGYDFQQLLIWHYPNNKSPQSRKGFKQTWEPIFFYRRKDSEKEILLTNSNWGGGLNDFDCHVAAVPQSNFNGTERKIHPAQKPVSVMRWLINAASSPEEIIADPFCGSGTTGIAAVQLGRKFHGIEIDKDMMRKARQRIIRYGK